MIAKSIFKKLIIVLSIIFAILLTDYIYNCVDAKQIVQYMNITWKQIGTIIAFVCISYIIIKYSEKTPKISYFLSVIAWYIISTYLFQFELFSYSIVKIPYLLFITLLTINAVFVIVLIQRVLHRNKVDAV